MEPTAAYVPLLHMAGEDDVEAHAEPPGQLVHAVAPARAYDPLLHATGRDDVDAQAYPEGHCVHERAPAREYEPALQGAHVKLEVVA